MLAGRLRSTAKIDAHRGARTDVRFEMEAIEIL
jgi:hypothetical protein